ncbi:MAG: hypothetical protein K2I83_06070, partial [Bacteroidales bacterium]|nr:hypothetical protein [Bacteroidales bacterium]
QTERSDRKGRSESDTAGEEGKKRGRARDEKRPRDEKRFRDEKPRGRRSRREEEETYYSKQDWKSLFETDNEPKKTKKTAKKRK